MGFAERLFVRTAFVHSEDISVARVSLTLDTKLKEDYPQLDSITSLNSKMSESHCQVLERLGRYPGRNLALGRDTTQEEAIFLESPDCPPWSKPQASRSPGLRQVALT